MSSDCLPHQEHFGRRVTLIASLISLIASLISLSASLISLIASLIRSTLGGASLCSCTLTAWA